MATIDGDTDYNGIVPWIYSWNYSTCPASLSEVYPPTLTIKGTFCSKEIMNPYLKRFLSRDFKKLYKAGFIDSQLQLTCEGKEVLQALMLEKYKKELVELAEEKIKEEKK